jgi:hypothetical protein
MKQDKMYLLFKDLENNFDIENPNLGHRQRFLDRLNNEPQKISFINTLQSHWKPLMGIAASLVLLSFVFIQFTTGPAMRELASISPEMAETENFFTTTIESELERLNQEISPEYQELIVDALFQIELLEQNYQQLKIDLNESGNDTRVITAMISNYQNRIDLLQNVLDQIEQVKQELNTEDENSSAL